MRRLLLLFALCAVSGCGMESMTGGNVMRFDDGNRTIRAVVGERIDITLLHVGPGGFSSPPSVSSKAVRFTGAADVCPCVPAGPTQRFSFWATSLGTAIVRITSDPSSISAQTVEDTIIVQ